MRKPVENHLIVMTRLPREGRNKTRLIPALGAAGAAGYHDRLARHAIGRASSFCLARPGARLVIRLDGGSPRDGRDWLGECDCREQGDGDLGARMRLAAAEAFSEGAGKVVIIGTDCPSLDEEGLEEAFDSLDGADLVFGPACDGGYYLIGMSKPCDAVFADIGWGSPEVLDQSMSAARRAGVRAALLGALADVDTPDDLPAADAALDRGQRVSVIIPTLNEGMGIDAVLDRVASASPFEIIISDGGSADATVGLARSRGVKVVSASGGRGVQMNAAAAVATGEFLLFLHADTLPPGEYLPVVTKLLRQPGVSAGAFRFMLDDEIGAGPLIEALVNLRGTPYGDQGLFVRRRLFNHLGGFACWPVMEDLQLVRRLRKHGRIKVSEASALTSSRRWTGRGLIRTFCMHQLMLAAYLTGVSPGRIARFHGSRPV